MIALVLGLCVAALTAYLLADDSDASLVWEVRAAAGARSLLFAGPVWLAQFVATVFASLSGGSLWLWAWWIAAPFVGGAISVLRTAPRTASASPLDELQRVWARYGADPEWDVKLTPPMPSSWPPVGDNVAVWFGFSERRTDDGVEVSEPWAKLTMDGKSPSLVLLASTVRPYATQASLSPDAESSLDAEAVRRGDIASTAPVLLQWQRDHGRLATHPLLAPHLPS